jgi:radical SAM superfamily enzyme YgiQ (UPF0313 family)
MKPLNSTFVIPSWHYWKEPLRAQPLTQLYLATILEQQGVKVSFADFRGREFNVDDVPEADVYNYTVASPDFEEVKGIVKQIKAKFPKAKHIAGGPHPNIFPKESTRVFDSIALGRGEESIKQIHKDIQQGRLEQEYMYEAKPENDYPFPKREFLTRDKIVTSLFKTQNIPSTTVLFSHGCPFNCGFCANYNRSNIRRRSDAHISAEIDYLRENYGIRGLSLQDEICIPLNKEDAEQYLNMIKSKDVLWRGQIRAGIDSSLVMKAKESGCIELSFGLESVSKEVREIMQKRIRLEDVVKTMRDCRDNDIKTRLYLINGLPGEPENVVEATKTFISLNKPDIVLLSSFQPYPGCPIYTNPKAYGIKSINRDFFKYNHLRMRFKDEQDNLDGVVPFEYYPETKFGKSFTRKQIMDNLIDLQMFLIEGGYNK